MQNNNLRITQSFVLHGIGTHDVGALGRYQNHYVTCAVRLDIWILYIFKISRRVLPGGTPTIIHLSICSAHPKFRNSYTCRNIERRRRSSKPL